ncbi:hypothetical protein BH09ACT3_BH09ACT3_12690 [soil metagenome]
MSEIEWRLSPLWAGSTGVYAVRETQIGVPFDSQATGTTMHLRRIASTVLVAAVGVAVLAGCSSFGTLDLPAAGSPSPISSPGAEPSESAEPESVDDPDETADGVPPGGVIPATFPDDIPLIDGKIFLAAALKTGWVVVIGVDDFQVGHDEAVRKLEDAGFSTQTSGTGAEGSFNVLVDADYRIELASAEHPDNGPSVGYTIERLH